MGVERRAACCVCARVHARVRACRACVRACVITSTELRACRACVRACVRDHQH